MPTHISPLAHIEPGVQLGMDVFVGPFCHVAKSVRLGDGCRLDSHVSILGDTMIGNQNRFWPGAVIGADPQDHCYREGAPTRVEIGNENQFREGVTVNRGAEKEDGCTRIGHRNLLMANAHIAHNCHVYDNTMLVNGVLLGGHVHVHDQAIISGNSVVHHFATIGKLAFVSGGCRVPTDVPPYMMAAGSDNPEIKAVNLIGMRRAGISESSISLVRHAFKLLFRDHLPLTEVRERFHSQLEGVLPIELHTLLTAIEEQRNGKLGRAREAFRDVPFQGNRRSA